MTGRADEVSFFGNVVVDILRWGGKVVVLVDGFRRMRLSDGVDGVRAAAEVVARRRRQVKGLQKSILCGHS